ncbi:hypothetical protein RKD23_004652 [Streptomyces sp. SAI-170]|uniref:hypothetical protein n=1 Tax=Streptomyces sp. SAI-170 TaxID=3377729 RepID=UPI003C7BD7B9
MALSAAGLLAWPASFVGLLYVLVVFLSPAFSPLFALLLCYSTYRSFVQLHHVGSALNAIRVLQTYPWRTLHDTARSLGDHPEAEAKGMWIEFPLPQGDTETGVPLVFVKHYRSLWWLRRIGGPRTKPELKAQLDTLWFAGDPRFLGVVAVPAKNGASPRRLHFLYQPSAFDSRAARRHWEDVTPYDAERARRAGARLPESASDAPETPLLPGQAP